MVFTSNHRVEANGSAARWEVKEQRSRKSKARSSRTNSAVRIGDVITIALDRNVRVLKVADFAARRGSSELARALYVELTSAAGRSESGRALANAPSMR